MQGADGFTNNVSVYMRGSASSVQLAYASTLECDNDYYQASGTLNTTDASPCTLQAGATSAGTATIASGLMIINVPNVGYGELDVNAANLNFSGQRPFGKNDLCSQEVQTYREH